MCRSARLRLVATPSSRYPFHWAMPDEPGQTNRLHTLQLRTTAQVIGRNNEQGAILDTMVSLGEPLSIFPRSDWRNPDVQPHIEWLAPQHRYAPDNPLGAIPNYPGPSGWIFRDRYAFRLGLIRIQVYDDETDRGSPARGILHPGSVIARFLLDDSPDIPEVVFGFQASILNNRRLVREPMWDLAANRYRQVWWLEEA